MKKILFSIIIFSISLADAFALERDTIVVHDTVYIEKPVLDEMNESTGGRPLLQTKPVGRFDRGIHNYQLIQKGKWIGGLTFSFVNSDMTEGTLLLSILDNVKCEMAIKSINPYVGYAIRDNRVIGAKFGYAHILGELGNVDFNVGSDLSFTMKDMRYIEDKYTIGVFYRSYIGLDRKGIFGLFNETELDYKRGNSHFQDGEANSSDLVNTETKINELQLKINPGVAVFITKNVAAELSFGVAGLKYRDERQVNNLGEEGKRRNSGADFRINILNINIGLTVCL